MGLYIKKMTQLCLLLIIIGSVQFSFGQDENPKVTQPAETSHLGETNRTPAYHHTEEEEQQQQNGLNLPAISEQRINLLMLTPVYRPNRYWVQTGMASSIYDARRDTVAGRLSPGVQFGKRFDKYGFFASLELDRNFDFTLDTETLDVLNIGIGGEFLTFLGHSRTTLTAGLSILLSDTDIDEKGEVGWFVDFRPASLRWNMGESSAIELTPFSLDIIAPVTKGIPLFIISYMTVLSYEWSL